MMTMMMMMMMMMMKVVSLTEWVDTWFERATMTVILLNCVTLGLYPPCADEQCTTRCYVLDAADHAIYAYFAVEMCIKVLAMGFVGEHTYLADGWNRLDLFIVIAGSVYICSIIGASEPTPLLTRGFRHSVTRPNAPHWNSAGTPPALGTCRKCRKIQNTTWF